MKVDAVMSRKVHSVTLNTKFRKLWEAIFKEHVHSLPVVDDNHHVIGIITEEDLVRKLYPNYHELIDDIISAGDFEEMENKIGELSELTAGDIMCTKVIFAHSQTPVMRALSRMIVRNIRQLPVLTEDNVLIGMVSKRDIVDMLFQKRFIPFKQRVQRIHSKTKTKLIKAS